MPRAKINFSFRAKFLFLFVSLRFSSLSLPSSRAEPSRQRISDLRLILEIAFDSRRIEAVRVEKPIRLSFESDILFPNTIGDHRAKITSGREYLKGGWMVDRRIRRLSIEKILGGRRNHVRHRDLSGSGKPSTFLNIHDHPSPADLSLRIRIYT